DGRPAGVAVSAPERVGDAARALGALDPRRAREGYWALRCTLVTRREDLPRFDRAFAQFWGPARPAPPAAAPEPGPAPAAGEDPDEAAGGAAPALELVHTAAAASGAEPAGEDEDGRPAGVAVSAHERLRTLDFSAYGPDDLRRARRAMERLARELPRRIERRLEPSRARTALDVRRTLLAALHTDGVPLRRAWRAPRERPFKLVLVLDVSGSMQAYARALLLFAHAAVHADRRVEAFTFGTRLTRVTRALAAAHPDRALAAVARAVPDWSSGTRIGENVRALNERWGRRGLTRGAFVVILSDGWERGDPALLGEELARLRRGARRVVWVNPLAGHAGYEPLAAGMAAALPHLDRLLAGHDLASLEALVQVVCSLASPMPVAAGRAWP
ncbi:MAG TPA: VWA domain-containing protein, partial [Conexibacter sp.]|nr:VWA domain-containing protein [Conexibacter sp.]